MKKRKLKRRSVSDKAREQAGSTATPLDQRLLEKTSGVGAVVAKRIIDEVGTVEKLAALYTDDPAGLSEQVKGLSPKGASAVLGIVWARHPDLFTHNPNHPPGDEDPDEDEIPEDDAPTPEDEEDDGPENPFPGLGLEQLRVLVDQLNGKKKEAVEEYLEYFDGGDEEEDEDGPEEDEAPDLPAAYAAVPVEGLRALAPALTGSDKAAVEAYLAYVDGDDEPPWSTDEEEDEVPEEPTLPAPYDGDFFTADQLSAMASANALGAAQEAVEAWLDWYEEYGEEEQDDDEEDEPEPETEPPQKRQKPAPKFDPSKVAGNDMVSYLANQMKSSNLSSGGGGGVDYFKLSKGAKVFRLIKSPDKAPMLGIRQHTWRHGGKFFNAVDLSWLVNQNELVDSALSANKISSEDLDLVEEFGDPFMSLAYALNKADRGDDAKDANLWGRSRYFWLVVDRDDGAVKVFEASHKFSNAVISVSDEGEVTGGILTLYPDLLDPESGRDIRVEGNGRDKNLRRYKDPVVLPHASPVGVSLKNLPDLNKAALSKVMGWRDKTRRLFDVHGALAASVGMTPNTYGE